MNKNHTLKVSQLLIYFGKKNIIMFLNEDRFLDLEMENLKALVARAAAAVPQAF